MRARIVDHVYDVLWSGFGKPTHPEDVDALRHMIGQVVDATLAYVDDHAAAVRWDETQVSS